MAIPECPECGAVMRRSDSGEPEYEPGWRCPDCDHFSTLADLTDQVVDHSEAGFDDDVNDIPF